MITEETIGKTKQGHRKADKVKIPAAALNVNMQRKLGAKSKYIPNESRVRVKSA